MPQIERQIIHELGNVLDILDVVRLQIFTNLRVKHVIVAVNKMDLVDYDQQVFENIKADFEKLNAQSSYDDQEITFVPISALKGDNVAQKSDAMSWYTGTSVLDFLESLQPEQEEVIGMGRCVLTLNFILIVARATPRPQLGPCRSRRR